MHKISTLLLTILVLGTNFGCGANSSATQNANSATPLKIIRFGRGSDSVRLDPQTVDDGESAKVIYNIFDTLVRFKDDSMELEACLATSWEVADNGRRFTFHLRNDVTFHDNTPFDADAAKYTLERLKDSIDMPDGIVGSPYGALYEDIQTLEVKDPMTLVVTLKNSDVTFLKNLAMFPASIVSPTAVKKDPNAFMYHPVGSGPFRFSSWTSGVKVVIEKNKTYWGTIPKLDKVIFENAKDPKPRVRNFLKGDFDVIDGIRSEDVIDLEADPNITVLKQPGMNICYLALNTKAKNGTHNVKVRRAIALAIDRSELNAIAYNNEGVEAYSPLPPSIPGSIKIPEFTEHNLEKARALIHEAGYPNGLALTLYQPIITRPYLPDAKSTALTLRSQLEKIGIHVTIVENEWQSHLQKTKNGEHDMCLLGWSTDNGDADNFLFTFFSKKMAIVGKAQNVSFYENDVVEALLTKGRQTADPAMRSEIYKKVQKQIGKDAPLIPLMHTMQLCAHRKRLHNFVLHPMEIKRFYLVDVD